MKGKIKIVAIALLGISLCAPLLTACNSTGESGEPSEPSSETEKKIVSIEIGTPPTKTQYYVGETFDPAGMVVYANYNDSSKEEVTRYTISKTGPLEESDKEITITYKAKRAKVAITVIKREGGTDEPGPSGDPIVNPGKNITTRFEAENADISNWVISSANPTKIVERSDASGGKFLAAATGDTTYSGTFTFTLNLEFNAEITMTAAYAQTDKWKTYDENMNRTYGYLVDENRSIKVSGDATLKAREDITVWQRMTYETYTLPKGRHTIKVSVLENTSTGTPNIDYVDFNVKEIAEVPDEPETPSVELPENDFHTELQYNYITDSNPENIFNYATGVQDLSRPRGNTLDLSDKLADASSYVIQYSDSQQFDSSATRTVTNLTSKKLVVKNFKLGQKIYYRGASSEAGLASAEVKTLQVNNLGPRNVDIPGVDNSRDIGGVPTSLVKGAVLNQGLYYRTARLDGITTEGKRVLTQDLGIKCEIDLRDSNQCNGPYVDGIAYNAIPIPSGTESTRFEQFATEYVNVFNLIDKADEAPIALHCTAGADRTGIMSFALMTLLGCDYKDIARDYCFTNFGTQGRRDINSEFKNWWSKLDNYEGNSKANKCKKWLMSKGIAESKLEHIREIFIPGYEAGQVTPDDPEPEDPIVDYTMQVDDSKEYRFEAENWKLDNYAISSDNPSKIVERSDASNGKFLAAATGNVASGQYAEFKLDVQKEGDYQFTGAFVQTEKKKANALDMPKTYKLLVDNTTTVLLKNGTLAARDDVTQWEEFEYNNVHLTKGSHTFQVIVAANTGKGNPNIDYFDINCVESSGSGEGEVSDDVGEHGIKLNVENKVRMEAENLDTSAWVKSSDNASIIVERSDASNGKFLASSTGDTAKSGSATFKVYAPETGNYTFSGAFAQPEKKKNNDIEMGRTYRLTVDGSQILSLSGTLAARDDITQWEVMNFSLANLTKGVHSVVLSVVDNTGKGCPNVDYFDIQHN